MTSPLVRREVDFAKLPKLRIRFEAPFAEPHFAVIINPPFVDVNPIFEAVVKVRLTPYLVAIQAEALSEATAVRIYAQVYAEGVIDRCETSPLDEWLVEDWEKFFNEHPDHLDELRQHAEHRPNWGGRLKDWRTGESDGEDPKPGHEDPPGPTG